MSKCLFIVNNLDFFVSHRMEIALALVQQDSEVYVASGSASKKSLDLLSESRIRHIPIQLSRSGMSIINEVSSIAQLSLMLIKIKPELLHLITIKPVIYGGIVARVLRIKSVVAAVPGLGAVFIAEGFKARIIRLIVKALYRLALRGRNTSIIFQNQADLRQISVIAGLSSLSCSLIRGSGVKLVDYKYLPEPCGMVVTMASRLLIDKGCVEYIEAAKIVKKAFSNVRFRLVGDIDLGNPASISKELFEAWKNEGVVELPGYSEYIASEYAAANIVCLPSYREGLPKSLIEAAACGRAVVTTNVPGCRDAITPNITGLLVPVRDSVSLSEAILKLLNDDKLRMNMGKEGYQLAQEEFSVESVVKKHMEIYSSFERKL